MRFLREHRRFSQSRAKTCQLKNIIFELPSSDALHHLYGSNVCHPTYSGHYDACILLVDLIDYPLFASFTWLVTPDEHLRAIKSLGLSNSVTVFAVRHPGDSNLLDNCHCRFPSSSNQTP